MDSETQIVRTILRQNEFLLRRHLVLSGSVLERMRDNGLITDVTRRKIMTSPPHRQAQILLSSLENQGLSSLRKFLDVLKSTGHGWMVDHILDTDVTAGGQLRSHDDSHRRLRLEPLRADIRKSITAGVTGNSGRYDKSVSLGTLLKAREPLDPETASRGIFNTRTLLTDPIAEGPLAYPSTMMPLPGRPMYDRQPLTYPRSTEDIPRTLYGLNQAFADQEQINQNTLSVLRQEEVAIRQLMEQNARDQGNIRRKQAAVQDISSRLRDIHHRAKEVYEPSPDPNIGRYRLAQLNRIPWSIGR